MTVDELHRLLAAPELLLVEIADTTASALVRGLSAEHPSVDDEGAREDDSRVVRRARIVLRDARRLRRALDAYRRAVDRALLDPPDDSLPF